MYHSRPEMAQLPQVPQNENGKPDFSPMQCFKKSNCVIRLFSNNEYSKDDEEPAI